jgi:hypothetical protein
MKPDFILLKYERRDGALQLTAVKVLREDVRVQGRLPKAEDTLAQKLWLFAHLGLDETARKGDHGSANFGANLTCVKVTGWSGCILDSPY